MTGPVSLALSVITEIIPSKLPHWPFWIVAGLCVLVACFRAWNDEHNAHEALEKRIAGFPNLVLASNGFRVVGRTVVIEPTSRFPVDDELIRTLIAAFVVSLKFVNEPRSCTEESIANAVTAVVTVYDADSGQSLSQCPGRWIPEQGDINLSEVSPKTVDFPIGGTNTLGVVLKLHTNDQCYAFDPNPSWHPHGPITAINASEFRALIRLRCPYFDRTWTVRFRDLGHKRGLKALPIQES